MVENRGMTSVFFVVRYILCVTHDVRFVCTKKARLLESRRKIGLWG